LVADLAPRESRRGAPNFSRILRLALLASDIIDAILAGQTDQLERPLPASWVEQRARILESKASLAV
jgi:hypothetical protein